MTKAVEGSIPTRESLLVRLKDWEDQKSWQDFYDTYWRLIYDVAVRKGLTPEEAADALQETVVAVAQKMKEFKYDKERGSFKAWLRTQAGWRIVGQYRKRMRNVVQPSAARGDEGMENLPDPASEEISESLWDEEWHRNLLAVAQERVKAKVEPRNFQIWQFHVLKEWPVAQVTKTLGVSRTQVYVAKHRIGHLLKKEMARLAKKECLPPAEALRVGS